MLYNEHANSSFKSIMLNIERELKLSESESPEDLRRFSQEKLKMMVDDLLSKAKDIVIEKNSLFQEPAKDFSEEELAEIRDVKIAVNKSLKDFGGFVNTEADSKSTNIEKQRNWFRCIYQDEKYADFDYFNSDFWNNLVPVYDLTYGYIDPEKSFSDDFGFTYDKSTGTWVVGNGLIHAIHSKFKNNLEDRDRAFRIFILHECFHRNQHILSPGLVDRIGGFSKIIEDADYQADTYAFIHEFAYRRSRNEDATANPKLFFSNVIDVANQVVFAFNETGSDLSEIQIRRFNRILNWFTQYLLIMNLEVSNGEKQLREVLKILSVKPVIEITGPKKFTRDQREYFDLEDITEQIEIGSFYKNRILRWGDSPTIKIKELIEGVRKLDSARIKKALDGYIELISKLNR